MIKILKMIDFIRSDDDIWQEAEHSKKKKKLIIGNCTQLSCNTLTSNTPSGMGALKVSSMKVGKKSTFILFTRPSCF